MPAYPPRRLLLPAVLAWAGCASDPVADHGCDLSQPHVVAATTDFRVGALAAVTTDGCVADQLSSTSGDAVVRATSERLWVLNRTGGDGLLAYPHGDYAVPELELGAYRHDNPHDLVRVGDRLFLSLYDRDELVVLDAGTGSEVGVVDLAPWADGDGLPEADALLVHEGAVYLALQRLDRFADWVPSGPGTVLRIDPETLAVDAEWATDTNPRMTGFHDEIALMSGVYFEADGSMQVFHAHISGAQALETIATEQELGFDLGGGAAGVVLGTAFDVGGDSVIGCLDGAAMMEGRSGPSWFADAVDARGVGLGVVVAERRGWSGSGGAGILDVDPDGCAVSRLADGLLLDPFSVAVVPAAL